MRVYLPHIAGTLIFLYIHWNRILEHSFLRDTQGHYRVSDTSTQGTFASEHKTYFSHMKLAPTQGNG